MNKPPISPLTFSASTSSPEVKLAELLQALNQIDERLATVEQLLTGYSSRPTLRK